MNPEDQLRPATQQGEEHVNADRLRKIVVVVAALNLAYTAAGRLDATYMLGVKAWDVVGGIVLIQEAGGRARGPQGGQWYPDDIGIFATNARLYTRFRRLLLPKA